VARTESGGEATLSAAASVASAGDLDDVAQAPRSRGRELLGILARGEGGLWTFGVFVVICIIFGTIAPDFFSQANWVATSEYAVEYLLLALGQTFVIATAGIDLSCGAVLGFSAMLSAVLMQHMLSAHTGSALVTVVGLVVALATGTIVGLVNGLLITKAKLAPFIVTLGMLGIATGGTDLLDNGNQVSRLPSQIISLGSAVFLAGWLPAIVLVAAAFAVITWLLLARTRFGMRTYAIGSNRTGSLRAGINVDRHLIKVYALSGFLAGVAGICVTAQFSIASPIAGANDELDAIAAVVIGGASLFGGTGTIFGTVVGTLIISILVSGLVLINVQPFWQEVAVGVVLIVAVLLDQLRRRVAAPP
jgi:ribose transport system permease protein